MNEVTLMTHRIRAATADDYPAMANLLNATCPPNDDLFNPDSMRFYDEAADAKYRSKREVLEVSGEIVGYLHRRIPFDVYHPQKYFMTIAVHPDHRGRGLGTALYEHAVADLRANGGLQMVRGGCRSDMTDSLRFLEKHGFVEEERWWKSTLDLARFDPSKFEDDLRRVRSLGIEIKDGAEVRTHPDWLRRLYEICIHVDADMPMAATYTPPPFEVWQKWVTESPKHIPSGMMVAVDGDRYIGVTALEHHNPPEGRLWVAITGVHREYRRKGIATALKVRSMAWAKEAGFADIFTANSSVNDGMLGINVRLGFEKLPAWIGFVRNYGEGS